ncbi:MAG: hypothetical protein LPJ89_10375 [Hymenobacteraceae bacterium]|nr:hypothetical protein [Hymenobacteraceae bacterium]
MKVKMHKWAIVLTLFAVAAGVVQAQAPQHIRVAPAPNPAPAPAPAPDMVYTKLATAYASKVKDGQVWVYQSDCESMAQVPGEAAEDKTKNVSHTFKVSAADKLVLENKYGRVHVNTWNKNEISINVSMKASGTTEAEAQKLLDRVGVQVQEDKGAKTISLKTTFDNVSKYTTNNNKCHDVKYEVNYTVNMPKNNPLELKNSFGDVYVGDFSGPTNLTVKYGNLKTEKLQHKDNQIKVAFGGATIPFAKQADINCSYSKLRLDNSDNLDLKSSFSEVTLADVNTLNLTSKYDKLNFGTITNLTGSSGFSKFTADRLSDKLDMTVSYCDNFEVKSIGKNFNAINLDSKFSTLNLHFDRNAAFNFDVNTRFSNLNVKEGLVNYNRTESTHTTNDYKGRYGSASPKGNVVIKAQYGNVKFQQQE